MVDMTNGPSKLVQFHSKKEKIEIINNKNGDTVIVKRNVTGQLKGPIL